MWQNVTKAQEKEKKTVLIRVLKPEFHLKRRKKFSPYLTENTARLHYNNQSVNIVYGNTCENHINSQMCSVANMRSA